MLYRKITQSKDKYPMALNKITDLTLRHIKPTDKVRMISDVGGLVIRVRSIADGGAMSFMQSYRIKLKANTLATARTERYSNTALIKQGIDPNLNRKLEVKRAKQAQSQSKQNRQGLIAYQCVWAYARWIEVSIKDRKNLAYPCR